MTFTWKYPVYLIPLDGGYVSVVEPQATEPRPHHLAVFTSEEAAAAFMHYCQIPGSARPLNNAREFGWLLQSLQQPVSRVAFDPQPDSLTVECRWDVAVQELLKRHLVADYSPWNYPVLVIRQEHGYASIEGQTSQGSHWTAIAFFTSREKSEAYVQASGTPGTLRELADASQTAHVSPGDGRSRRRRCTGSQGGRQNACRQALLLHSHHTAKVPGRVSQK